MEIAGGEPVGRAHAESQTGRHTKAAILRDVAFGHIGFMSHQVESYRIPVAGIPQRLVDVGNEAPGNVRAEVSLGNDEWMVHWGLAYLVDHAAGRSAPEGHGRRPLQHLNLLVIERVAVVAAEIAHAVEKDVIAGSKPAQGKVVPLRASLAGCQADARSVPQGVAQCGRALLLDDRLGDGGD